MTQRLLQAILGYSEQVNGAIHTVADIGAGADLSGLTEATYMLRDAIQNEPMQDEKTNERSNH